MHAECLCSYSYSACMYYSQGCAQGEALLHLEFRPLLSIPGGRRPPLNLFRGGAKSYLPKKNLAAPLRAPIFQRSLGKFLRVGQKKSRVSKLLNRNFLGENPVHAPGYKYICYLRQILGGGIYIEWFLLNGSVVLFVNYQPTSRALSIPQPSRVL